MKVVAVINQKGGVGKTTTVVNLGAALARLGRKVLLLDMDPQANLSLHVDLRTDLAGGTTTDLLLEDRPLESLLRETTTPGLWAVPTDTSLGGVEQVLANRIGRETILRESFQAYGDGPVAFDYVLADCPPSLGVLSANALVAADEVIIPMQTQYFSLQGMAKLTEVIELVQRRLNPELKIAAVLPCMVDLRTRLTGEVLENIQQFFGDRLSRSMIRNNVKVAEAPSFGVPVFDHAPESNGAFDYWAFAAEFLERHGETVTAAQLREVSGLDEWVDDGAPEPGAEAPAAQTPAAQTPAAQTPAAQTPEAQTPEAQTHEAQTPAAETLGDTPMVEPPSETRSETPAPVSQQEPPPVTSTPSTAPVEDAEGA